MPKGLYVADKLTLPLELVTKKNAILAMSGAGKSNTAVVLAEEMYAAGIPFVAVDPKGDWYGARSSRDGKSDGLPIPVLGGLHGDLPLEPTAGKVIGNLIAEQRLTCILDVSEFDTRQQQFRFLADLAETLLKRNREPLHLFLEEADDYLPQRPGEKGELPRCLGAWSRLVRRGRFRGMGVTLISQRSAGINKDVLTQVDTLIAMRVTSPQDKTAIRAWVEGVGLGKELVDSLSELANGEAWLWSPQALKLMQRVQFRRRETFDSGETPVLGKARPPATLADVDLDALKDEMSETIERAKADDPKLLHAEIAQLKRQVHDLSIAPVEPRVDTVEIEIPILEADLVDRLDDASAQLYTMGLAIAASAEHVAEELGGIQRRLDELAAKRVATTPTRSGGAASGIPRPARVPARREQAAVATPSAVPTGGAPAAFLAVLAQHPEGRTRRQLSLQSGYKLSSSTFRNAISTLKGQGLIDVAGQEIRPTDAGLDAAGDIEPLPTGPALLDHWRRELGGGAPLQLFNVLVDHYPNEISKEDLGAAAGYAPTSSTFRNALSKLRTYTLVDKHGPLRLTDELMEAAR